MVLDRTLHSERQASEPPKRGDDNTDAHGEDNRFCLLLQPAGGEEAVVDEAKRKSGGERMEEAARGVVRWVVKSAESARAP